MGQEEQRRLVARGCADGEQSVHAIRFKLLAAPDAELQAMAAAAGAEGLHHGFRIGLGRDLVDQVARQLRFLQHDRSRRPFAAAPGDAFFEDQLDALDGLAFLFAVAVETVVVQVQVVDQVAQVFGRVWQRGGEVEQRPGNVVVVQQGHGLAGQPAGVAQVARPPGADEQERALLFQ